MLLVDDIENKDFYANFLIPCFEKLRKMFFRLREKFVAEITAWNGKDFLECLKKDSQTSESILRKHTR